MRIINMNGEQRQAFEHIVAKSKDWCRQHQLEVGLLEMTLGASAIAIGIHNGAIEMGRDIVGSALSNFNAESGIGGLIGGVFGGGGGEWLGSIGVAALGTAISVPGWVLIGGGALLFGALGYMAGDVIHNYLHPPIDLGQLLTNASLLAVGTALLVDGARRVAKDRRVRSKMSRVAQGVIYLCDVAVEIVARSMADVQRLKSEFSTSAAAAMVVGGGVGSLAMAPVAASTVTVLGSHTLGGAALSLGLVSAPIWPVLVGGMLVAGVGYVAWKTTKDLVNE